MSTNDLFSVAGKTAVVTGGSRGIGLMIARGLVEGGAKVYIASRSAEVCDKVAAELSGLPGDGECVSLPTDLSTEEGCKDLADAVKEREDKLDILINNAGIQGAVSLRRHDGDAWREVLSLNLEAVFHLTKRLLPLLRKAGTREDPARVINVGSVAGSKNLPMDTFAYAASKAGVHHLTPQMARSLGPTITFNAISPGPFESKMMENVLAMLGNVVASWVPLKRIGRPEDVAGAVVFLSSRAGAYVTGAVIPVDGGMSI